MIDGWLVRLSPGTVPQAVGTPPSVAERDGLKVFAQGTVFGAAAPADAVLDAYRRSGRAAFAGLRGRFSAIVWDAARDELLATRDPLGIGPLFHARDGGGALLISPWAAVLRAQDGVGREIDPLYVGGQLIVGLPAFAEETPFPAVRRIPAGHLLRARGRSVTVERYWDLPEERPAPADVHERFAELLEQAVRRAQGEGRAAIMLSGGIDSALIAAASARVGGEPPLALAILNPTPEADEERSQRTVAGELGLELVAVAPDDVIPAGEILPRALRLGAPLPAGVLQPVGDELMRRARDAGCSAIVDGNGGDEWLMPFTSLAGERIVRLDPRAVRDMHGAWPYLFPEASPRDLARLLVWDGGLRPLAHGAVRRSLPASGKARLHRRRVERAAARFPGWLLPGRRERLAEWSIERFPRGSMFRLHRAEKRDVLTSSYTTALAESHEATRHRTGVELVSPIWDADLVAFLASLPQATLVAGGRPKSLALRYLEPVISLTRGWPAKTFGDSVVTEMLEREWDAAWRFLGGTPKLEHLGVVAGRQAGDQVVPGFSRQKMATWDVMAVEAWLRDCL